MTSSYSMYVRGLCFETPLPPSNPTSSIRFTYFTVHIPLPPTHTHTIAPQEHVGARRMVCQERWLEGVIASCMSGGCFVGDNLWQNELLVTGFCCVRQWGCLTNALFRFYLSLDRTCLVGWKKVMPFTQWLDQRGSRRLHESMEKIIAIEVFRLLVSGVLLK